MEKSGPDSWMAHMLRGEFAEAWKFTDADLQKRVGIPCWHLPRHFQYLWNGCSLQGKRVLVRCYHGLGDSIQFIRYAPMLKEVVPELIVWAQEPLIPLFKSMPSIDQLMPLHDGQPEADFDVDVEIMELPHIFRTTVETIPASVPYLFVEPTTLSPESEKMAVGLVWKAGDWDERRSIPFSTFKILGDVEGVEFYILQAGAQSAGWEEGFGKNPGEFSVFEYARIVRGLDLLITVDSMPAHLAGALGVPVWNLLHASADWRWMEGREDSPWYPTMRLFRQQVAGDWAGVVERVAEELRWVAVNIATLRG